MAQARLSMQQIVRQRRRAAFVGRTAERDLFRASLVEPGTGSRHFLFHVHGPAGVGKSMLLAEFEHIARECGALTAYVDESAAGIPEALEAICRQFASQGRRAKDLERLLTAHRERRHEAELAALAALEPGPDSGPSAGSMAVARAGLAGLGLVPGAGAFAGVLDPTHLAQGADRLRTGLGARFRSYEDVQLVLSPESVLTPVLVNEIRGAAADVPWIVLLFDTYERTGLFLDAWLWDLMTSDRHGTLPGTILVVTAGRNPADSARWGGLPGFVTPLPLRPFTEAEARGLLADRGVRAEPVVAEVLRLTGGLPVLVSLLADSRPAGPEDVRDPSATAVERFLKGEQDPVRRAAAIAGALPRRLDADVFRVAADLDGERADELYGWVSTLPFADPLGGRLRYHDVVRAPMLRLQRGRSPRGWAADQRRLADAFRRWREETETGRETGRPWADEDWWELRTAELYHRLCARDREALSEVLHDLVEACDQGEAVAARWVGVLEDAGRDADVAGIASWGRQLSRALAAGGTQAVLEELLVTAGHAPSATPWTGGPYGLPQGPPADVTSRRTEERPHGGYGYPGPGAVERPDTSWQAEEQLREHADWDVGLPPALMARIHRDRALSHAARGEYEAAVTTLDRALGSAPDDAGALALRGEYGRVLGRHEQAAGDLERAVALDPADAYAWASLGATRLALGDPAAALTALDRALELRPDYPWALIRRGRVRRVLGDPGRRLADLDRAVALQPDSPWAHCERGDALRATGRDEEALAAYDHALTLDPEYASAYASRGVSRFNLGRHTEALADLDRALELDPSYTWARTQRDAVVRHRDG
nr:tetratricopeptide repeat protein [Streptomyces sp. CB02400]